MCSNKNTCYFSIRGGDRPLLIVGLVLTRNALYGSLVQQTTRNTSLPFVHTARRSYRWTSLWVWGTGSLCDLWKLKRTVWSKGKRSRNKASVGEPADGSLRFFVLKTNKKKTLFICFLHPQICKCFTIKKKKNGKDILFSTQWEQNYWDSFSPICRHLVVVSVLCMNYH